MFSYNYLADFPGTQWVPYTDDSVRPWTATPLLFITAKLPLGQPILIWDYHGGDNQ